MNKPKLKEIENYMTELSLESAIEYLNSVKNQYNMNVEKLLLKYQKKQLDYIKEQERLKKMYLYEEEAYLKGFIHIAGVDEVGRGPLAGPVVTAAVILPRNELITGVNDSKKLSEHMREALYEIIMEKAVAVEIGIVDEKVIDEINILNATKKAMEEAISRLDPKPDYLLIDAVRLDRIAIEQKPIIKGDSLSISIAAASIVAKVTRDRLITEYDNKYPQYGFKNHKGYGTEEHIAAIKKFGICPIHRVSFTKNFI